MLSQKLELRLRTLFNQAIQTKVFPGEALAIVTAEEVNFISEGNFTYEPSSSKVNEQSIFDVASLTKVIPTSSLALQLVDQGKLGFNDKLIDFVPEFRNSQREKVTIQHLLTQTIDFVPNGDHFSLARYKNLSANGILEKIFTTELVSEPGKEFHSFNNACSILLGLVVERVAGKSLPELADEQFFLPLEMKRTTFFPEKFPTAEVVPTEFDSWRNRLIQGEVHDESAFVLGQQQKVGSAGLFSTAADLSQFVKMLLQFGKVNGKRYFSEEIIKQMITNQTPDLSVQLGLGWEIAERAHIGQKASQKTISKTGFTGCLLVIDYENKFGVVILSNRIYPQRPKDSSAMNEVRCKIVDAVVESL